MYLFCIHFSVGEECLSTCTTNSLWRYRVGKSYSYSYQVSVVTVMKGTSDEDSSLTMKAQAKFIHSSKCNFQLQVTIKEIKNSSLTILQSHNLTILYSYSVTIF